MEKIPEECHSGLELLHRLQENSILNNNASFLENFASGNYCIVAFGVEHFRLYNKWFGRKEGDELLIYISEALHELEHEEKIIIGNVNADNFYFIVPNINEIIDRCVFFLKEQLLKNEHGKEFKLIFGACSLDNGDEILGVAYDNAKNISYDFIDNGTAYFGWYSKEMDEEEKELRLLPSIRKALAEFEFCAFFQPKCNLATGKIIGSEALVRWIHPKKGNIMPGQFIPVLEHNGYISKLDQYVWENVCKQLRRWLDKGLKPLPVSVNISRMDFDALDVADCFSKLLNKYNLSPDLLELEITESAFVENEEKIAEQQARLKQLGLRILIDDFGSGYSSLNSLKDINADIIKLDIKFMALTEENKEKGVEIINSVISMAHHLNMLIIVEGVETHEQAKILLNAGCRYCQGFRFYKPMPPEAFERYLANESYLERQSEFSVHTSKDHDAFEGFMQQQGLNSKEIRIYIDVLKGVLNIVEKVVRVNLTNGRFRLIKFGDLELSTSDVPYNIYEWWQKTAREGMVHPEDLQKYLQFGDAEYLRRAMREHESISMVYRRKYNDEFRYVKFFVARCSDYSEDNQAVMFSMLKI